MKDLSKEVLWYGENEPLPKTMKLSAGPLKLTYNSGSIRSVKLGSFEVVRMIYVALRDHNWGTIIPALTNEAIEEFEGGFKISYQSLYSEKNIRFVFHVTISGDPSGTVVFDIEGEALSEFMTNRTGFCVLHPVKECMGNSCEITEPDGQKKVDSFPELISPHQPMKNMAEMSWHVADMGIARIKFIGEIFEMEDQRNWTDDSYKTYCRPLELPFPYAFKTRDKIHQRITLSVECNANLVSSSFKEYHLRYDNGSKFPLPKIGVGKSTTRPELSERETVLIKEIGFDDYDIHVIFNETWQKDLEVSIKEANSLDIPLHLNVQFSEEFQVEIELLSVCLSSKNAAVNSILILHNEEMVTSEAFLAQVIKELKMAFPSANIGAGTSGFFAELNRQRIENPALDFLSYSITPQVHAFDNLTLVENLMGQSATVKTAKAFAKGKKIHIRPITLKIHPNPSDTSKVGKIDEEFSTHIDVRQMSLFGAGWILGSIKQMAQAGADSITYFETTGEKGIILGDKPTERPEVFQVEPGAVFPFFYVLREVLNSKTANVISSESSHPTEFEGVVLEEQGKKIYILANFTDKQIEVRVDGIALNSKVKKLDEKSVMQAMYDHEDYQASPYCEFKFDQPVSTFTIRPFGIVFINE